MNLTPRKSKDGEKSLRLEEIAKLVEGQLIGDGSVVVTGVAGIKEAEKGDITFLSNARYLPFLQETQATAVIVSEEIDCPGKVLIRTKNPSKAFTKVVSLFIPPSVLDYQGIHPTAIVGKNVILGNQVTLGPHAVIEDDCLIGDQTYIGANVFVGKRSKIGQKTIIYPNVTIREEVEIGCRVIIHSGVVIGSDGFGYEAEDGSARTKIPQIGSVVIEDDVEIGANTCVDRGRFKNTWIKKGTKIDNLVQIAHNVIIGENSIIVSQVGISGSAQLGKNVIVAGQAGIVGHIQIGDNVIVGGCSGVTKSVPANTVVLGGPARPMQEQKRIYASLSRLPELFKEIAQIRKKLGL